MNTSLTQLQSYNTMYKLLDNYSKEINAEDILALLSYMLFFVDGSTADPAIWSDWLKAINNKSTLTEQEAFDGMIRFLEIYRDLISSADTTILIDKLRSAKDCYDMQVPIVKQWNLYLKIVLQEPKDSRTYLQPTKK